MCPKVILDNFSLLFYQCFNLQSFIFLITRLLTNYPCSFHTTNSLALQLERHNFHSPHTAPFFYPSLFLFFSTYLFLLLSVQVRQAQDIFPAGSLKYLL